MGDYTLPLALVDFFPNFVFLIGAYFVRRVLVFEQTKQSVWIWSAGVTLVFLGGILKAIWKLLYTLAIADVQLLAEIQFVLLAPGFLMMLLATIRLAQAGKTAPTIVLPALALWKIPLLVAMTLCSIGAEGILTYLAFRRSARVAGYLFAIAVIGLTTMAIMASGEQTIPKQWVAEIVNSIGQSSFMFGGYLFFKHSSAARQINPTD